MRQQESALVFLLKSIIPYSHANLLLTYRPQLFLKELGLRSGINQSTLKHSYYRAQKEGYVDLRDSYPKLTQKGIIKVSPYIATKLKGDVQLLVIFDVPEDRSKTRQQFRNLLKQWKFKQVQKSVWSSKFDYREAMNNAVNYYGLSDCVEIFESVKL